MYFLAMLAGGMGLLAGGLFAMRHGLGKLFSPALVRLLGRLTLTPWRGLVAGAAGAALLQSSTALTLATIGLVSAEYLTFHQGLGLVLGANIGTCSTVGLLAVSPPREDFLPWLAAAVLAAALFPRLRPAALAMSGLGAMFAGVGCCRRRWPVCPRRIPSSVGWRRPAKGRSPVSAAVCC
jgi:phosphate:Na+ symporter